MHPDAVRNMELAVPGLAGLPPGLDELAAAGEAMDTGIAVAVRNVQVAVGVDGDVAGTIEGPGGALYNVAVTARPAGVGGLVPLAHGHQQVAFGVVLKHDVAVLDRHIQVLVVVNVHTVCVRKLSLAPRGQEVAVAVEDYQGVLAAVEEIDTVLGVCDDGRLPQHPAFGQLLPVGNQLVGVLALANGCHRGPPVISALGLCIGAF